MSAPPSTPPDTPLAAGNKRTIAALQDELNKLKGNVPARLSEAKVQTHMGRCFHRLVSLFDSFGTLVEENDRRLLQADDEDFEGDVPIHSDDQNRAYQAFQELVYRVPFLKTVLNGCDLETQQSVLRNLRRGADGARGDDTGNLKQVVVHWVSDVLSTNDTQQLALATNSSQQPALATSSSQQPALEPTIKYDRGFVHYDTSCLLCPIEFDWSKEEVRKNIRDGHADFMVTAQSWPLFLYNSNTIDPDDFEKGLFRGSLLLRAYLYIFTSPSSSSKATDENRESRPIKKRKGNVSTRANVATLCGITSVTPRSIAYIATQVRFALSSSGSWTEQENDFNYADFYNAVVDYFEITPGPVAQARIDNLLKWWNCKVFGRAPRSSESATSLSNNSRSKMALQRAARERLPNDLAMASL